MGNPKVYPVIVLLHKEAGSVKMLSDGKLRRYQRKKTRDIKGQLFDLWDKYDNGDISLNHLLKKCGTVYAAV